MQKIKTLFFRNTWISTKNIIGCLEIRFHSYLLNLYDLHRRLEYLHIIEGSEECAGQDLHFFKDLSWLDFKDVNWVHFKDPICVHRAPPIWNIFWHHQFSDSLIMYFLMVKKRNINKKSNKTLRRRRRSDPDFLQFLPPTSKPQKTRQGEICI